MCSIKYYLHEIFFENYPDTYVVGLSISNFPCKFAIRGRNKAEIAFGMHEKNLNYFIYQVLPLNLKVDTL